MLTLVLIYLILILQPKLTNFKDNTSSQLQLIFLMAPMIGGQIKFITRKKDLLHTDFGHIDLVCCRLDARKKESRKP